MLKGYAISLCGISAVLTSKYSLTSPAFIHCWIIVAPPPPSCYPVLRSCTVPGGYIGPWSRRTSASLPTAETSDSSTSADGGGGGVHRSMIHANSVGKMCQDERTYPDACSFRLSDCKGGNAFKVRWVMLSRGLPVVVDSFYLTWSITN